MPFTTLAIVSLSLSLLPSSANAHIAAFAKGMYCQNGTDPASPNLNSNAPVSPLYQLSQTDWWFQHDRGCDVVPPPEGEFLELPAGGDFTVQLATNQAFTDLSYGGKQVTDWPDGGQHPEDWNGNVRDPSGEGCIPAEEGGYMHTQNETMAQGTAFAIAYESDLSKIRMEDLVVFTVLEHTPWRTRATYAVPASLPACPSDAGCTCAWLWVPQGCGQPNMYMQPYRCRVVATAASASSASKKLAKAQPPTYCADDETRCVRGAKQMIVFNQLDGDNTALPREEGRVSPAYNMRNGFRTGAQDDIFEEGIFEEGEGEASGDGGWRNETGTVVWSLTTTAAASASQTAPQTTTATTTTTTTTTGLLGHGGVSEHGDGDMSTSMRILPVTPRSSVVGTSTGGRTGNGTGMVGASSPTTDTATTAATTTTGREAQFSIPEPFPDPPEQQQQQQQQEEEEEEEGQSAGVGAGAGAGRGTEETGTGTGTGTEGKSESPQVSYTTTFTGRVGRPTRFTCYAEV